MARLSLAFLGTFQASLDGRTLTRFRSVNVQGLLVYLALNAGRAIPREVLATIFWPEAPENAARANFRQTLYQLRKLLKKLGDKEIPFLSITRQAVAFNPESDFECDVHRFQNSLEAGDLESAADLYAGDLLPGFGGESPDFEDWLRVERERLHQLALGALGELTEQKLAQGKEASREAQQAARRQLALEPWRETAHRQLMLALALAGDRSGALAQYERCVAVMAEELGVPPAPETTSLYEAILEGNLPAPAPAPTKAPGLPHNLPRQVTPFFGRETELETLAASLLDGDSPLVTVVGPGGVGKTSLALAAGRQLAVQVEQSPFPDGVFFVSLAEFERATLIPAAILQALAAPFPGDGDHVRQLLSFMRNKKLLLILDNFEHLTDGAALVGQLLSAAPGLQVCVTSRQRLKARGEMVLPLGGLDLPPDPLAGQGSSAVRLFLQSARRVRPDYAITEEEYVHVAQICRFLEGVPLAIELAAAWIDTLPAAEIARQVQSDLDFLSTDLAGVPPRQRSMRRTFEYSWQMLSTKERALFASLSVFQGGFTRQAAQEVAGAALRLLARLISKSLLGYDPGRERYALHALLRQFGAEKLAETGEQERAGENHSRYYLEHVARLEQDLKGRDQAGALAAITADLENIRTAWRRAVRRGEFTLLSDTLDALTLFFYLNDRGQDLEMEFGFALEHLSASGDSAYLRDRILNRWNIAQTENPDFSPSELDRLLASFRSRGDGAELEIALGAQGAHLMKTRDFERSQDLAEERLAVIRKLNDPYSLSAQLIRTGFNILYTGRYQAGLDCIHEGMDLSRRIGNRHGVAHAGLLLSGHTWMVEGEYERAAAYLEETIAISREMGLPILIFALGQFAYLSLAHGDFEETERRCLAVRRETERANMLHERADCCTGLLRLFQGDPSAEALLRKVPAQTSNLSLLHVVHYGLSLVALQRGDLASAAGDFLAGSRLVPFQPLIPATFVWFIPAAAGMLAQAGDPRAAAGILAAGKAHPACPQGLWARWAFLGELEDRLQSALPAEAFREASTKGKETDLLEQVDGFHETLRSILDDGNGGQPSPGRPGRSYP